MPEVPTIQCPNCAEPNDVANAVCSVCNTPLTAYAGELTGLGESSGKLREQVAKLDVRPPIVTAAAVLDVLFALFGPIASVFSGFATRPTTNAEGTNYIGAAFGMVGPILKAIVLLPISAAIIVVAWAAFTQKPWGWYANLVIFGLLGVLSLFQFGVNFLIGLVMLIVAIGFAVVWMSLDTRAWYGQS